MDKLPREFKPLSNYEFTIARQVAAFKLMILPKLLYLFRTDTIFLSTGYIKALQTIVNRFIWKNKKPWSPMHVMTSAKQFGGIGAPDLRNYYLASILSQLQFWWTPFEEKRWLSLESRFLPTTDLNSYLIAAGAGGLSSLNKAAVFPVRQYWHGWN